MPPGGGVVLDPFAGSGSLACAAAAERERSISVEMSPEYYEIAKSRIDHATRQGNLFGTRQTNLFAM
jgi:site-specific DNA-methyltransferase (adenine-specific)